MIIDPSKLPTPSRYEKPVGIGEALFKILATVGVFVGCIFWFANWITSSDPDPVLAADPRSDARHLCLQQFYTNMKTTDIRHGEPQVTADGASWRVVINAGISGMDFTHVCTIKDGAIIDVKVGG